MLGMRSNPTYYPQSHAAKRGTRPQTSWCACGMQGRCANDVFSNLYATHPKESCRAEGYTATDIMARMRRMQGYNVLHPIGWDAFGLPAEQYALQTGTHPAVTTERNIARFRQQLQALGGPSLRLFAGSSA